MQALEQILQNVTVAAAQSLYNADIAADSIIINITKKEFEGDYTVVVFPLTRFSKKGPEPTGEEIGTILQEQLAFVTGFNVVKGFLNLSIADSFWVEFLKTDAQSEDFGFAAPNSAKTIMLEYSSPNTNKPLHMGHLMNNFLGYSVSEVLKANGNKVIKTQIINDRGIHICKSMLAWQLFGNGETPESSGMKSDHLVGKYYVIFNTEYSKQVEELMDQGKTEEEAKKEAPLIQQAQDMLRKWEQEDPQVRELWQQMNQWVYDGFEQTYETMGVDFDVLYYESKTYLLGRKDVMKGLEDGVFFKKEDGSIWVNLEADGLDEKVLLRGDGTALYITQDIGTATERFRDYPELDYLIYTVADEQNYHFKVLFKVLEKLGYEWAKECYHLSYGMVELPHGRMKSREGTVVDADDLMAEMVQKAKEQTQELGKTDEMSEEELENLHRIVGLGALKFFLLRVDPRRKMVFNPEESIELQGFTGPFIQYTYARIQSLKRKFAEQQKVEVPANYQLADIEKEVLILLYQFPVIIKSAGDNYDPSEVATYAFNLAKAFNKLYAELSILNASAEEQAFRIGLSSAVGSTLRRAVMLLGMEVPERM